MPSTEPTWVMLDWSVGAGDPEVGQLDDLVSETQQVPGLDVAVDDAVAVRVVETAARLGDDVDGLLDVQMAAVAQQLGARNARPTCSITMKCW